MADLPITEDAIRTVAADVDRTAEEIGAAVETLHDVIDAKLLEHYKKCWLEGGDNHRILSFPADNAVWFAFNRLQLEKEVRESDYELEPDLIIYAAQANKVSLNETWDATIKMPVQFARKYTNIAYYPIRISKSDDWERGIQHVMQIFENYLFNYDMSPAEALDLWAVDRMDMQAWEWAKVRQVGDEAVRKNVRQARDKFSDDENGRTYDVNDISTAKIEDIPDEFHDTENDMIYMPTYEQTGELKDEYGDES